MHINYLLSFAPPLGPRNWFSLGRFEKPNSTEAVSFTASMGLRSSGGVNVSFPTQGSFVSWPCSVAILKDALRPEGAKLGNFLLSDQFQNGMSQWSARGDIPAPAGYPGILGMNTTNSAEYMRFMAFHG